MTRTSETLEKIKALILDGAVLVSAHGYDEIAADGIFFGEMTFGLPNAELVEDYPAAFKGSSVLVLQRDSENRPFTPYGAFPEVPRARQYW